MLVCLQRAKLFFLGLVYKIVSDYAIYAIWLLSLTEARLGGTINLKWEYINFGKGRKLEDTKMTFADWETEQLTHFETHQLEQAYDDHIENLAMESIEMDE